MSELSVNDHLEGILSDFEALKRSFDIDDDEDIPTFSSPSPVSSPQPPASPHFYLNHSKPVLHHQSSTRSYSTSSPSPSDPSPLPRPRTMVTSLSFNKGSSTNRGLQNNSSSTVTRAASFQNRFSPNSYSAMFGAGSDNDSLHSSTSSLEYSSAGPKMLSYPGPRTHDEYPLSPPHSLDSNFNQRKFSSVLEPRDIISKPLLDPHSSNGDLGAAVGMSGAGGRLSPGFKFANSNWNGRFRNAGSFGEEHHTFNNHSPKVAAPPNQRKPSQLSKFPLDLETIVPTQSQLQEPPPRSPGSGVVSSSASLSSLDSSDATPYTPLTPPGPQRVPRISPCPMPLSPAQTPLLEVLSGPLVGQLDGLSALSHPSAAGEAEEQGDSVGSILQRIASFSHSQLHTSTNGSSTYVSSTNGSSTYVSSTNGSSTNGSSTYVSSTNGSSTYGSSTYGSSTYVSSTYGIAPSFSHLSSETTGHHKESAGDLEWDVPMEDTEARPTTSPHTPTTNSSPEMGQEDLGQAQEQKQHSAEEHREVTHSNGSSKDHSAQGPTREHPHQHPQTEEPSPAQDSSGRQNGGPLTDCRAQLENGVHAEDAEGPLEPGPPLCPSPDPALSYLSGADLFGYVGIEAVLDQMRRKTMKAGFEFNVMVVGQSGLGKSTLVNTLFKSRVSRKSCSALQQENIPKTVRIHQVSHMIEEKGVKMKLTVVDTPGFGDHINNNNCWEPIVSYVNEQYERYLREELNVTRKPRIPDTRVHCCVYFLPPTGHRLRPIDVEFMKHLGSIVSIVPVIAKADTLTLDERLDFKHRIRQDLAANGIQVYPQKQYDEDPEERLLNSSIRECIPFAVVGTDREHQVNGHKVLGRKTKWGIIEVENAAHCEFSHLRDLLIRSHLQDLKDVTHNILYETYRVRRLNQANVDFSQLDLPPVGSPLLTPDTCDTESQL